MEGCEMGDEDPATMFINLRFNLIAAERGIDRAS
jgi:hypothetical protein